MPETNIRKDYQVIKNLTKIIILIKQSYNLHN